MFAFLLGAFTLLPLADLPSGPNPGDKLQEFKVHAFSGPNEGKEFEVIKATKNGPTLLIFVHKITRPALQLLRPVDEYAAKEEKLAAHIVWLTGDKGDKDKTEEFLKRAKNSLNFQVPQSIALDGKDGPPAYGLNDQVALTVLVAKEGKVVNNFAFTDPNANDGPKVIAAIAKVLGREPPKSKEEPKEKTDGRSPELQKLMRRMIQKDNDEAAIRRVVEAMTKWAGDDQAKRRELRDYARLVVRLGYGNDLAQTALKKLAEE